MGVPSKSIATLGKLKLLQCLLNLLTKYNENSKHQMHSKESTSQKAGM
ncbi:hypothetical protein ABH909_002775 [Pseudomonas sp. BS3782 TE3695]